MLPIILKKVKKSEISNENCSGDKKFQWRNEKGKKRNRDPGKFYIN